MSDTWYVKLEMAVHLRTEHGWTWRRLRHKFTGMGSHFWDIVRREVEVTEDD